jgi:hypothetical protein
MFESAHIRSLSVAAPVAGNSKTETCRPFRRLEQTACETQVELADPILAKLLNAPWPPLETEESPLLGLFHERDTPAKTRISQSTPHPHPAVIVFYL